MVRIFHSGRLSLITRLWRTHGSCKRSFSVTIDSSSVAHNPLPDMGTKQGVGQLKQILGRSSKVPFHLQADITDQIGYYCSDSSLTGKCLVVCSSEAEPTDRVQKAVHFLRKKGLKPLVFPLPDNSPTTDSIMAANQLIRRAGIEFVVAVGGGGVIEMTKGLALVSGNDSEPWEYSEELQGRDKAKAVQCPSLPVVISPTSPNSAELRRNAYVIFQHDTAFQLSPLESSIQVALVDPKVFLTLPNRALLTSVESVLAHCIECYTSVYANGDVKECALLGIRYVLETVSRMEQNSRLDLAAASTIAAGSLCSSAAMGVQSVGLSRSVALATVGRYKIAYNTVLSSVWLPFLRLTVDKLEEQDNEAADRLLDEFHAVKRLIAPSPSDELSLLDAFENIKQRIWNSLQVDEPPSSLNDEDFTGADFERIASAAETEHNTLGNPVMSNALNNDVRITRNDILETLKEC